MTPEEQRFREIGRSLPGTEESQMFGKPCFKISGKAFTCFYHNEMVFKLPSQAHRDALALPGAQLFDPAGKGRPMKEWVQVPAVYADKWAGMAAEAMGYVSG